MYKSLMTSDIEELLVYSTMADASVRFNSRRIYRPDEVGVFKEVNKPIRNRTSICLKT